MDNRCLSLRKNIPFLIREMDGMGANRPRAENAVIRQTLNDAFVKSPLSDPLIGNVLGAMDMKSGLIFCGIFRTFAQAEHFAEDGVPEKSFFRALFRVPDYAE